MLFGILTFLFRQQTEGKSYSKLILVLAQKVRNIGLVDSAKEREDLVGFLLWTFTLRPE